MSGREKAKKKSSKKNSVNFKNVQFSRSIFHEIVENVT